ncbi:cytoplasmic tRNA 2-thiolation protein 2 isoform X2 [Syngnathoides biaculeatus]|uniref:cytoplasmic tRNA 2-thiolation protein 2 isoform X2 n=1 Tax=Syngnathoides biaculeatus TaxID=300417 RepID=UPI002ADD339A|nr:cytoplasmic tRNA 2-thiolation protein 2 isoform X2 [Syngnathoides biaculeatus]XP_061692193.1 cytoplasmic tRNA 2-thiolation protein 2 isoform X2 [Syngnathoides biaculeatus]
MNCFIVCAYSPENVRLSRPTIVHDGAPRIYCQSEPVEGHGSAVAYPSCHHVEGSGDPNWTSRRKAHRHGENMLTPQRDCFEQYFRHKFRAILGKNRVIFPGEKVLLAVSGGPSSSTMLRQVEEGLSQNAHKKLRFTPGIVYIDEGGALDQSLEERQQTVAIMEDILKATGFPFYIVPLEKVLDLPSSVIVMSPSSNQQPSSDKASVDYFICSNTGSSLTLEQKHEASLPYVPESQTQLLQQLIDCSRTLTAKEDILSILRHHLLVHTARCEGYKKLMFGDNCTRLAVKLLSSISLGRGAHLAQDTSFSDSRYGDIVSLRPMRDYSSKEIAYYCHIFSVPSVVTPNLQTKNKEKASIQRLTESFVNKLQVDFPSTVSTIYRTSEKLQTTWKSTSANSWDRCLLCMCSLDTAVENASAFQATRISERLSQSKSVDANSDLFPRQNTELGSPCAHCCSKSTEEQDKTVEDKGCCSCTRVPDTTDMSGLLCYSCQLTIKDMSSVEYLPQYILSEAQVKQRRSHMKEEISDCLLDV